MFSKSLMGWKWGRNRETARSRRRRDVSQRVLVFLFVIDTPTLFAPMACKTKYAHYNYENSIGQGSNLHPTEFLDSIRTRFSTGRSHGRTCEALTRTDLRGAHRSVHSYPRISLESNSTARFAPSISLQSHRLSFRETDSDLRNSYVINT